MRRISCRACSPIRSPGRCGRVDHEGVVETKGLGIERGTIPPNSTDRPSPALRERVASAASRVRVYEGEAAPHPPIAYATGPPLSRNAGEGPPNTSLANSAASFTGDGASDFMPSGDIGKGRCDGGRRASIQTSAQRLDDGPAHLRRVEA